jgi:putative redox protein
MIINHKENYFEMKQEIILKWNKKMSFSSEIDGHKIVIDAANEFGGENNGPRPKALLLLSLAGCSGMDVVSLMEKMRINYSDFKIIVEGNLNEDHPKKYNSITLKYIVTGKDIEIEKIEKAIKLSEEKYCGVWATLKPGVKIDYKIEIL